MEDVWKMEERNLLEMVPLALEEGQQLLLSSLEHMISMIYLTRYRWNPKVHTGEK